MLSFLRTIHLNNILKTLCLYISQIILLAVDCFNPSTDLYSASKSSFSQKMLRILISILIAIGQVTSFVLPRDDSSGPPNPGSPTVSDPGLQDIPDTAKAPNTFNNGQPQLNDGGPWSSDKAPDLYQPRDIDIPFGWLLHGNISMFPAGQCNDPTLNTDNWTPNVYDFANQSACGIPDNAIFRAKAAIHPYWLKYAGLDRKSMLLPNGRNLQRIETCCGYRVLYARCLYFTMA